MLDHRLCDLYFKIMLDTNPMVDVQDRFDMAASNVPDGLGYKAVVHYGQTMEGDTPSFSRFDYGAKVNMQKYG